MSENAIIGRSTEIVDIPTCLELLASQRVGRVAMNHPRGPVVLPVHYIIDRGSVVFRTGDGTKLAAVRLGAPVTFQADASDPDTGAGWSVMVRGYPEEVWRPEELALLEGRLEPPPGRPPSHHIRILSVSMSGRRLVGRDRADGSS